MTLPEASRCFQISIEELQFYEKNGLLKGRKTKDGEKDYLEADLQYIGKFHFLQTAGMDADSLKQFVRLLERGADTREEQIRILRKFRFGLLEAIHGKQQELDQVDYLIHEIKEQGNPKGYLYAKRQ